MGFFTSGSSSLRALFFTSGSLLHFWLSFSHRTFFFTLGSLLHFILHLFTSFFTLGLHSSLWDFILHFGTSFFTLRLHSSLWDLILGTSSLGPHLTLSHLILFHFISSHL